MDIEHSFTGTGYLNNGPGLPCQVITTVERIDVSTNLPKADPAWSFTDSAGHFHAFNTNAGKGAGPGERYPTLITRVEVVPCGDIDHDPDCDGANVTHWHCSICDEEVTPGTVPGPHHEVIDGRSTWEAKISVPVADLNDLLRRQVSLRVEVGDGELFGLAIVSDAFSMTSEDSRVTLTLRDASALGHRRRSRVPA